MDVGHLVRFSSQPHPYLMDAAPCLDLDCDCSLIELTLTELDPSNPSLRDRLTFTLRVCLQTWTEQDPPPRSLEVESLAREFLARFPRQRIRELGDAFTQARARKQRLASVTLSSSPHELVPYSEVMDEGGGIRAGHAEENYFFVFEGREFFVEDHYCANPGCDCQQVHVEFWERIPQFSPQRKITIEQRVMVTLGLDGKWKETRYTEESKSTTKYLVAAWRRRCGDQLAAFRRRYELLKTIGTRSFSETEPAAASPKTIPVLQFEDGKPETRSEQRVGRNAACPCGSGRKFKRCCGQRVAK